MLTPAYALTATERVLPRLALDMTTASLDARVSVTRALDTATRVNSSGLIETVNADLPRFDFNLNTGGTCNGLLVEESRTNILQYATTMAGASWAATATGTGVAPIVTTDAGVSPDGTNNATKLEFNAPAGSDISRYSQTAFVTSAGTYTGSIYIKAFSASDVGKIIAFRHVASAASTLITLTSTWTRVERTEVRLTSEFQIILRPAVGTSSGVVSVLVYGGQLEVGAFATSLIFNSAASTTTRNADVAVMTGANFSDWWAATSGAAAVRIRQKSVAGTAPWLQFDDASADNIIALRGATTNPELYIKATTDQAQIDAGTIAANTNYGFVGAWTTDNCAAAINGGAAQTDTTATIPVVTQARLGSDGTNYLNGWLQTVRYWPQRLIDAETQAFSKL